MMRITHWLIGACAAMCVTLSADGQAVVLVEDGQAAGPIAVDTTHAAGRNDQLLRDAAQWLAEALEQAGGSALPVIEAGDDGAAAKVVIARGDAYPKQAAAVGMDLAHRDAYAIVTEPGRVYLLGATEA